MHSYVIFCIVPTPTHLNVTLLGAQKVSELLTLKCNVTIVRGITSRVDIVWSSNGTELKRIEGANSSFVSENFTIYVIFYDILQLSTRDDGREFQCGVLINSTPVVMATNSVTLELTGKFYIS